MKYSTENSIIVTPSYEQINFNKESITIDWDSIAQYRSIEIMLDLENYFDPVKKARGGMRIYSVREVNATQYYGKDLFGQSFTINYTHCSTVYLIF